MSCVFTHLGLILPSASSYLRILFPRVTADRRKKRILKIERTSVLIARRGDGKGQIVQSRIGVEWNNYSVLNIGNSSRGNLSCCKVFNFHVDITDINSR